MCVYESDSYIRLGNCLEFSRTIWQRGQILILVIMALFPAVLFGCSPAEPELMGGASSPTQPSVTSTELEPISLSEMPEVTTSENSFEIYLVTRENSSQQTPDQSYFEYDEKPLLSLEDIVFYREETHEIELTPAGYKKIAELSVPVTGIPFVVCVNGQPKYTGSFWSGYSSLSFDGVVIDTTWPRQEKPVIKIQLGYPVQDFFRGEDPRPDPLILHIFEEEGKLE